MKSALVLAVAAVGLLVGVRAVMADSADPTFDDLDKNHDGVLSKDEVAVMFPATNDNGSGGQRGAGNGSGFGGGRGGFGGGGGLGAGGGGFGGAFGGGGHGGHGGGMPQGAGTTRSAKPPNIDEIFKSWDKDGNGTISREEFDTRPHKSRKHSASSADDQRAPPSL